MTLRFTHYTSLLHIRRKKNIPYYMRHAIRNVSSDNGGQQRTSSTCSSKQCDKGLHCPQIKSLDTKECMNGVQRPGRYFAHAQDDLNMRILRMLEGTVSFCAAHSRIWVNKRLEFQG